MIHHIETRRILIAIGSRMYCGQVVALGHHGWRHNENKLDLLVLAFAFGRRKEDTAALHGRRPDADEIFHV